MRIVEIQIQPALRVAGETEDGGGGCSLGRRINQLFRTKKNISKTTSYRIKVDQYVNCCTLTVAVQRKSINIYYTLQ